jgi:hypothetical protein
VKYLLLIYRNPSTWDALDAAGPEALRKAHGDLIEDLVASGEFLDTRPLSRENARTLHPRDGLPVLTDGPFTEAKEVMAGYYLVDCADLDRATEIATRLPEAPYSPIEIREFDQP